MVPIHGRPFLEYLIDQLRHASFSEVVLLTGYLGQHIRDHFGDGQRFGIAIKYCEGAAEWETGQRLWEARQLLQPRFLLLYADNFAPLRMAPLCRLHESTTNVITLTVAKKEPGNIRLGPNDCVDLYDPTRQATGLHYVEIGYMMVQRDPVLAILQKSPGSFSAVLQNLAKSNQLGAWEQGDVYHSISDPERLQLTEEYLRPKRIILLDRDGVINQRPPRGGYVTRLEDFAFIPEHVEVFQKLAGQGFEFIVISNQAGIARGIMKCESVDEIHAWMIAELAKRGIVVREVLYCPHYINDGCSCRKPLPGMFFEASRRHALRLDQTVYVGDDVRDAQAANAAGCACLLVGDTEEFRKLGSLDIPLHKTPTLDLGMPWILSHWS